MKPGKKTLASKWLRCVHHLCVAMMCFKHLVCISQLLSACKVNSYENGLLSERFDANITTVLLFRDRKVRAC